MAHTIKVVAGIKPLREKVDTSTDVQIRSAGICNLYSCQMPEEISTLAPGLFNQLAEDEAFKLASI